MTLYQIKSDVRSAAISQTGAELRSLKNLDTGEEYLWHADPDIWDGTAPILFPIVGGLKDGHFQENGQSYSLPKHGLVRAADFSVIEQSSDAITFGYRYSQKTLEQYPWRFNLQVTFKLTHDSLLISYRVENLDENLMLFNIGSHPAFHLPEADSKTDAGVKGSIGDYSINFSEPETLERYVLNDALLSSHTEKGLINESKIELTDTLFDRDALIYRNIQSRTITLSHRERGPRVSVDTGGAPHLGIWAKPAAAYVCIEPWWGYNDFDVSTGVFADKQDIQKLPPGDSFETAITIKTFD